MPSNIDVTKPVYGNPTTQSVRDNFSYAHDEITDLQSKTAAAPFLPLGGGTMNGMISLREDAVNPLELVTKRYVDNLAFGPTGGVSEAPSDGMFYARGSTTGGMTWAKNPLFQGIHIGLDKDNDYFNLNSDAAYNFIKFNTATEDYFRFNRSSKVFELVTNNVISQSWSPTGIMFYPAVTMNGTLTTNTITISSATPALNFNSTNATDEYIYFKTNNLKRWAVGVDGAATTFGIYNYDASGNIIGKPLTIANAIPGNRNILIDARGNIGTGGLLPPTNESAGGYFHTPGLSSYAWYGNMYYDGTNYRVIDPGYGFITITNAGASPNNLWAWMASKTSGAAGGIVTIDSVMSLSSNGQLWTSNVGGGVGLAVNNSVQSATGALISNSSGGVSLQLNNNSHARVHYVSGTKQWSAGLLSSGEFYIADEVGGLGYLSLSNNLTWIGSASTNIAGKLNISGQGICCSLVGNADYVAFTMDNADWSINLYYQGNFNGYWVRSFSWDVYTAIPRTVIRGSDATCWVFWGPGASSSAYWSFIWSDRKMKWNIKRSEINAIDTINKLNIISCDTKWIAEDSKELHWDCALIADEIEDIIPGAYIKGTKSERNDETQAPAIDSYDSIREMPLLCTALKAIQELSQRLVTLENRIQ
jgi:hypothetical protein